MRHETHAFDGWFVTISYDDAERAMLSISAAPVVKGDPTTSKGVDPTVEDAARAAEALLSGPGSRTLLALPSLGIALPRAIVHLVEEGYTE